MTTFALAAASSDPRNAAAKLVAYADGVGGAKPDPDDDDSDY